MLNEKKIRLMTDLARYEEGSGKEDLRISRYYRTDYMGLALFRNFFLITLGYLILLLLVSVYYLKDLMEKVNEMNLALFAVLAIGGYAIILFLYSVATYVIYSLRYGRSVRNAKKYEKKLEELEQIFEQEELNGGHGL